MNRLLKNKIISGFLMMALVLPVGLSARKVTDYSLYESDTDDEFAEADTYDAEGDLVANGEETNKKKPEPVAVEEEGYSTMVVGGVAFVVVAAVVAVVMVLSGKGKNAGRAATRFGRKAGNAAAGAISALVSVVDDDRSANYNDGYGSDGGYSSAGSAIASEDDYVSDDELAGLGLNAADEGVAAYRRAQAAEAQGRLLDRLGR